MFTPPRLLLPWGFPLKAQIIPRWLYTSQKVGLLPHTAPMGLCHHFTSQWRALGPRSPAVSREPWVPLRWEGIMWTFLKREGDLRNICLLQPLSVHSWGPTPSLGRFQLGGLVLNMEHEVVPRHWQFLKWLSGPVNESHRPEWPPVSLPTVTLVSISIQTLKTSSLFSVYKRWVRTFWEVCGRHASSLGEILRINTPYNNKPSFPFQLRGGNHGVLKCPRETPWTASA